MYDDTRPIFRITTITSTSYHTALLNMSKTSTFWQKRLRRHRHRPRGIAHGTASVSYEVRWFWTLKPPTGPLHISLWLDCTSILAWSTTLMMFTDARHVHDSRYISIPRQRVISHSRNCCALMFPLSTSRMKKNHIDNLPRSIARRQQDPYNLSESTEPRRGHRHRHSHHLIWCTIMPDRWPELRQSRRQSTKQHC